MRCMRWGGSTVGRSNCGLGKDPQHRRPNSTPSGTPKVLLQGHFDEGSAAAFTSGRGDSPGLGITAPAFRALEKRLCASWERGLAYEAKYKVGELPPAPALLAMPAMAPSTSMGPPESPFEAIAVEPSRAPSALCSAETKPTSTSKSENPFPVERRTTFEPSRFRGITFSISSSTSCVAPYPTIVTL